MQMICQIKLLEKKQEKSKKKHGRDFATKNGFFVPVTKFSGRDRLVSGTNMYSKPWR
jgi:hypothetical protein